MDGCYEWFCGSGEWAGLFVSIIFMRVAKSYKTKAAFEGGAFNVRWDFRG
jgi:hypothetical protein